jgi:mannose-6-phosphate isomerase
MAEYKTDYQVTIGERPWGEYITLTEEYDTKVKRITVNVGQRLSLQKHKKRDEHWFVYKGVAKVTLDESTIELPPGNSIDIPRNIKHRIENIGKEPLVLIEIQTGDYFGEDDIERFEDDYNR